MMKTQMSSYRRSPRLRPRSGFTLVELATTITLGGVLMSLSVGVLHQAFTFASIARDRSQTSQSVNRLARQFREDVHFASGAEMENKGTLKLTLDDTFIVTYTVESLGVRRSERSVGASRQELYSIGNLSRVALTQLHEPDRVELEVHRKTNIEMSGSGTEGGAQVIRRRIVAVVGLWKSTLVSQETSP